MIDVTDIPEAAEDTRVTLVGRDGDDEITMEELAEWSWRFPTDEIPCVLGKRVPRVYVRGGKMSSGKRIIMMIGMRILSE